jgi:hypothetical protein
MFRSNFHVELVQDGIEVISGYFLTVIVQLFSFRILRSALFSDLTRTPALVLTTAPC